MTDSSLEGQQEKQPASGLSSLSTVEAHNDSQERHRFHRGFASPLNILCYGLIANGMGQTVVFAVIPMLGLELQLSILQINSLVATTAAVYFFCSPWWGRRTNNWGCKSVILVGFLGYTLSSTLFILLSQMGLNGVFTITWLYALLLMSRIGISMFMSASQPAALAYVASATDINFRTRAIARVAAANGIGTILGPALVWTASIHILSPLLLQSALVFFSAIFIWYLLPERSGLTLPKKALNNIRLTFWDKRFRTYILAAFLVYFMMAVVQQTLSYYFRDLLKLDPLETIQVFGSALMVSSFTLLFSQLVIVQKSKLQPYMLIRIGLPIVFVGYFSLSAATQLLHLYFGMACFGLGMGMTGPGLTAGATLLVKPEEQGSLGGLLAAIPALGFMFGPLLGGYIYVNGGERFPYVLAASVILLVAIFSWLYEWQDKKINLLQK